MLRLIVVWLHLLGAAVWVGGLLYGSHLLLPALARGERGCLGLLARARVAGWSALGLVVLTGLDNLRRVGLTPWLAAKLVLVIGLLALAADRDFARLPRAARAIEGGADPAAALVGLRRLDRVLAALAAAVLFLAVGVARGR